MSLYDLLIEKERERKERVRALLVKALRRAKLDYAEATVYIPKEHILEKIPAPKQGDTILMLKGKVIDKDWYNRVVVSYLSVYAQKLVERGDLAVY